MEVKFLIANPGVVFSLPLPKASLGTYHPSTFKLDGEDAVPDPVEGPEVVPPAQEGDIQTGRRSWLKETKVASPAEDPKVPPAQNTEEEKDSPDDPA